MGDSLLALKRPFIWLSRFRCRCGYGVHSPFAFNLITHVIYEKEHYYAYRELCKVVNEQKHTQPRGWNDVSTKVNRLLFRLANRFQPQVIVECGKASSSSLYLQAGMKKASFCVDDTSTLSVCSQLLAIDFLYIHNESNPMQVADTFDRLADKIPADGVCVIKGIHRSYKMKQCWRGLTKDDRVGITFDLYDVGILFFDRTKIKQHYLVNF